MSSIFFFFRKLFFTLIFVQNLHSILSICTSGDKISYQTLFLLTRYLKVKQIIYELISFILLSLHYYCLIQWQKDWRSFEFVIWFIFFFSLASSVMFVYWHSRFVRSLKSEWNRYTCNVCILQVLGKINNYTPFSTWILEFFCDLLKFGHSIFVSISEIVNN